MGLYKEVLAEQGGGLWLPSAYQIEKKISPEREKRIEPKRQ
jgi:hypothetical protein